MRLVAVAGADETAALAQAKTFMDNSGIITDRVNIDIADDTTGVPGLVSFTATVTIPFSDVSIVGDPFNLNVTEVRGDSAMVVPEP